MKKSCPTKIFRKFNRINHGFSLVELLIAASILGLLTTFGLARFHQFNRRQILSQAAQELRNNLRLAQEKALAGEKPNGWCTTGYLQGYRLSFVSTVTYVIDAVCSVGDPRQVKSFKLLDSVTGPADGANVLFKVLAQGVDEEKTFTLNSTSAGDESVTVTKTGEIK